MIPSPAPFSTRLMYTAAEAGPVRQTINPTIATRTNDGMTNIGRPGDSDSGVTWSFRDPTIILRYRLMRIDFSMRALLLLSSLLLTGICYSETAAAPATAASPLIPRTQFE